MFSEGFQRIKPPDYCQKLHKRALKLNINLPTKASSVKTAMFQRDVSRRQF